MDYYFLENLASKRWFVGEYYGGKSEGETLKTEIPVTGMVR